ncbi:MAG: hypothetical protein M0P01_07130 [Treponema sp.]|jgi:uncharacterized protein (UPF0276 family)|nr:hypothetical protein [Treponema sp.]
MVSTITKRIQRLEKAGAGTQQEQYLASLTHEEKKARLWELYSNLFEIIPPLTTQEEYETDLLHRFPEVLQPGYKPPVIRAEMTNAEKYNACLSEDAWYAGFKRGLTKMI